MEFMIKSIAICTARQQ